jgi:lysophospholipase L1-like esterase
VTVVRAPAAHPLPDDSRATIVPTALFPRPRSKAPAPAVGRINGRLARLADGKTIRFVNINDRLTNVNGDLLPGVSGDGVHLEEKGYDARAAALKPIFTELLGLPPGRTRRLRPPAI